MMHPPPFTITPASVRLVAEIGESLGRLSLQMEEETVLRLRRINRIRTIHVSLAIEGNTLSKDRAIQDSTAQTDSAPFIEFMLGMMRDAIARTASCAMPFGIAC
jgi:Fic family protein